MFFKEGVLEDLGTYSETQPFFLQTSSRVLKQTSAKVHSGLGLAHMEGFGVELQA